MILTRSLIATRLALLLTLITAASCTRLPELGNLSYLAPRERSRSVLSTIDPAAPRIRLDELQLKGSHNSFHRAPRIALSRSWRYDNAPLDVQLESQGVRMLELDVRYARGELVVGHLPFVDDRTTCKRFLDCLATIKKWSRAHPSHLPVFVFVQVKDALAPSNLDGKIDALDFAITRVFARDQLLVPEDVAGDASSLREAIVERGWPSVEETRGRVAFVMFGARRHKRAYTRGRPKLDGRVMFVAERDERQPHTSILMVDNPLGQEARIARYALQHFLVRTRADAELVRDRRRRDAALQSGAHLIASDFVAPRHGWLELDAQAAGRCNPLTTAVRSDAAAACTPLALLEVRQPALALSKPAKSASASVAPSNDSAPRSDVAPLTVPELPLIDGPRQSD